MDANTAIANITDPSVLHTFMLVINWGPGVNSTKLNLLAGSTSYSETHQYLDDNPTGTGSDVYAIGVSIVDDDGGTGSAGTSVTVNNVAPVVAAVPDAINFSGDIHSVAASFTDDGTQDTHTATIDWGEGAGAEPAAVAQGAGSGTASGSHQYFLSGGYTVTVTVTDDDGGVGTHSHTKTVVRVPAIINIKPGNALNNINPGAQGLLPVAILTTEAGEYGLPLAVDATTVDVAGLRFGTESTLNAGGGGSEPHGKGVIKDDKDLDEETKDGDLDIKLHFEIPGSGIEASTTEACEAGAYTDGDGTMRQFFGCDFVSTVPPANGGPPAPARPAEPVTTALARSTT